MLPTILMVLGIGFFIILIGFFLLIARVHKKVPQGKALIRTGFGGAKVALDSGIFVIPILHKVEEIDISLQTIVVEEEIITKEEERISMRVVFYLRINKDRNYTVEVAQTVGCARASSPETLHELFYPKCLEAIKTVATGFTIKELRKEREAFKKGILQTIGVDLNGYILDDCAIEQIRRIPNPNLEQAVFVLIDHKAPLKKGEKVLVVDQINDGKSYIVRRIIE
ncbi:SPFH domain-containing protein [Aureispira anguillae]|uniref:SPFH domain-containing protein n=1 Tax=Aureispira anguillae TaxID=2864201 RepID=A0A916DRL8_9BACT|nr:SPFH domain-containing protein [Aureispira anguillae]BDS11346.1 SPFH domain-containing protein [Aureispira anguillae]